MVIRDTIFIELGEFDSHGVEKSNILYYARTIPTCDIYEILELKIRTVMPDYFAGVDKRTKQAFLFGYNSLGKTVFKNRNDALNVVKNAEKSKKKINNEKYYEEY